MSHLATQDPVEAPPGAASGPNHGSHRRRGRRRLLARPLLARRLLARRLLAVAVLLGVGGGAAASAVATVSHVQRGATEIGREIGAVNADLGAGRVDDATAGLQRIQGQLDGISALLGSPAVRAAALVPVASRAGADSTRLAGAADHLLAAARCAVSLQRAVGGDDGSALVNDGRLDPAALTSARDAVRTLHTEADAAITDLQQVRGGPGLARLLATRDALLASATAASHLGHDLASTLPSLQDVFGGFGDRSYLVVLQDEQRPLPGVGYPVAVARVDAHDGRLRVVSPLGGNLATKVAWTGVSGNPYTASPAPRPLAQAFATPDFSVAGEEVLRWADARTGRRADAVVALDATALQAVLAATGTPTVPAAGRQVPVTTVAHTVTATARRPSTLPGDLLHASLRRLTTGPATLTELRALGWAAAQGHLRTYARNAALERAAVAHGLAQGLGGASDDVAGLFVLADGTAPDPFATRETTQDVQVSGSLAAVTRTTVLQAAPAAVGRTAHVRLHVPLTARSPYLYVNGTSVRPRVSLAERRRVYDLTVPVTARVSIVVRYGVPLADAAHYRLRVDGQGTAETSWLTVRLSAPSGAWLGRPAAPAGADPQGRVSGRTSTVTVTGAQSRTLAWGGTPTVTPPWWRAPDLLVGPWLLLSFVVARLGRRRPAVPVAAALAVYALVPTSAAQLLTGVAYESHESGLPPLHPASWIVLFALWQQVRTRGAVVRAATWGRSRAGTLALAAVPTLAVASGARSGTSGLAQVLEGLVAAPALFVLMAVAGTVTPGFRERVHAWFVRYALAVAALAVAEGLARRNLVYAGSYATETWSAVYERHGFRASTLLDHPLNTTLLLGAALPLVWSRLAGRARAGAAILLLLGVVATGSRSGLLVTAAAGVALAVQERRARGAGLPRLRRRSVALGTVGAAGALAALGLLARTVLSRFAHDGGSASLRVDGAVALLDHLPHYLLLGSGAGSAETLTRAWLGSANSAENPLVMLAVDLGVPAVVLLLTAIAAFSRLGRRRPAPAQQSLVAGLALAVGYSSFGTRGIAVVVLWTLVGLCALEPDEAAADDGSEWPADAPQDASAVDEGRPALVATASLEPAGDFT